MIPAATILALLALPRTPAQDVLRFAPGPESTVEKTFTLRHDLVVQTMKIEGAGSEQVSQVGLEVISHVALGVADTYRGIENGRPLALRRSIREAALHVRQTFVGVEGERRPTSWVGDSPLVGTSVVFTWVPEEQDYGRHYDEKESLEEYLAGLREDLDLRAFLPADAGAAAAGPGASWAIEPAAFQDVFAAGGEVPRAFTEGGGGFLGKPISVGVAGPLAPIFGGEVTGEARATWKETVEEGGARLAVIEVRAKIEAKRDQTQRMRESIRSDERTDVEAIDRATIDWKFDGEGTLRWNLGAGRFEDLTLAGREEVASEIAMAGSTQRGASRQQLALRGAVKLTAKAKSP